jgi:hypothetical protein
MGWRTSLIIGWKCSECGATDAKMRTTIPYNWHQKVCSKACARARKSKLQRARRGRRMFGGHTPETIAAIRRAGFSDFNG